MNASVASCVVQSVAMEHNLSVVLIFTQATRKRRSDKFLRLPSYSNSLGNSVSALENEYYNMVDGVRENITTPETLDNHVSHSKAHTRT